MATYSGTGTGTSGGSNYTLTLTVTETSYSTANNTSTVAWSLTLKSSNGYSFADWSFPITANVDGSVYNETTSRSLAANSTITIASGTKTITHNSDGTKSIACGATVRATSAYYLPGNIDVSGTLTLTTIPRKSSVSCNSFNIGDATTITITRASESFTHTLTWAFGSASGTIATKTSAISVPYTFNAATLYAQIPNGTYGTGTITCQTYSGNTSIGTTTCNFRAYAVASDCTPTVAISVVDTNATTIALTGSNTKLIKGFSDAYVTVSATPKNSATISSYLITTGAADARTSTSSSHTFTGIKSNNMSGKATDSRGYYDIKYKTFSGSDWINYVPLAFTKATVVRPESTADTATLTMEGNFFNGSFGAVTNTLTAKYRYKETGGSYGSWVTVTPTLSDNTFSYTTTLSSLSHNTEFVFQFYIEDSLMSSSPKYTLTKGIPIIRVGKDYVEINGDLEVNSSSFFWVVDAGSNANGQYIKFSDGTMICVGRRETDTITWTQDGSAYIAGVFNFVNFPQTFYAAPYVTKSIEYVTPSSRYISINGQTAPSTTNPGGFNLKTYWNATNTNARVVYVAIGKWK